MPKTSTKPKYSPEVLANLEHIATIRDEDIDLSDMPEVTDFTGWTRGKFYRPVKQQVTLRLDSDLIHWFKTRPDKTGDDSARGYQTRINAALRRFVEQEAKRAGDKGVVVE